VERNSGNVFSYDALRGRGRRELAEILTAHRSGLDDKDADGKTVLHSAVDADDVDAVEALIAHGADLEARDRWGNTALWRAVYQLPGSRRMVTTLLDRGADPHTANNHGATPAGLAGKIGRSHPALAPLVQRMTNAAEVA
jgi:ankyrin repeat protein